MLAWPSRSDTTFRCAPSASIRLACVCRRSRNRSARVIARLLRAGWSSADRWVTGQQWDECLQHRLLQARKRGADLSRVREGQHAEPQLGNEAYEAGPPWVAPVLGNDGVVRPVRAGEPADRGVT